MLYRFINIHLKEAEVYIICSTAGMP